MNTFKFAKRVLIYGDSITWGRIANDFRRFDEQIRWTCVLQKQLGEKFEVIEEGLRARMLEGENPHFTDRDGVKSFGPILGSHLPIDLLVVFLGTNDCVVDSVRTSQEIAAGLEKYHSMLSQWLPHPQAVLPEVLIIAPPHVNESVLGEPAVSCEAGLKSKQLAQSYRVFAEAHGFWFFDAAREVTACPEDGIHLDAINNVKLGQSLVPVIQEILS